MGQKIAGRLAQRVIARTIREFLLPEDLPEMHNGHHPSDNGRDRKPALPTAPQRSLPATAR